MTENQRQQISEAAEAFADQLGKCMTTFNLSWEELNNDPIQIGRQAAIDVTATYHYEKVKQRNRQLATQSVGDLLLSSDS